MRRYQVAFTFLGKFQSITLPENRGLADILNGFWVDENLEWCVASKDRFYIMPHHILSIEVKPCVQP